jgi:hypothetical protein
MVAMKTGLVMTPVEVFELGRQLMMTSPLVLWRSAFSNGAILRAAGRRRTTPPERGESSEDATGDALIAIAPLDDLRHPS